MAMRQVPNNHKMREHILACLVAGCSLRATCAMPGMPSASTVCGWVRKNPDFARRYKAARRAATSTRAAATKG